MPDQNQIPHQRSGHRGEQPGVLTGYQMAGGGQIQEPDGVPYGQPPVVPASGNATLPPGMQAMAFSGQAAPGQAPPGFGQPGADQPGVDQPGPGRQVDTEQQRFDAFGAETEEKPADPVPQVRNGRVLLAVLTAAVLLLVIPFGIVWLVAGPSDNTPSFPVGSCVKQSGGSAVKADCGEDSAYEVVQQVDARERCPDPSQPVAVLPASQGENHVLCLKPAADS